MCHVSRVMCHVSHVAFHVSRVTCHLSHVTYNFFIFIFFKVGELVGGGSVINEPYPSSFLNMCAQHVVLNTLYRQLCPEHVVNKTVNVVNKTLQVVNKTVNVLNKTVHVVNKTVNVLNKTVNVLKGWFHVKALCKNMTFFCLDFWPKK